MIDVRADIVRPSAALASHYRALGYWEDESLPVFMRARALRFADNIAVTGPTVAAPGAAAAPTALTYHELDAGATAFAARLAAAGVSAGQAVIVQVPNSVEFLSALFGVFYLGAVPIFALPAHRETELAHFTRLAGATAHVVVGSQQQRETSAKLAEALTAEGIAAPLPIDVSRPPSATELAAGAATATGSTTETAAAATPFHDGRADDLAFLQVSGGTTGVPKLIPRTHTDYLYTVRESAAICRVTEDTRMLVCLPAAHNFAMSSPGILGVLHAGGTIVMAGDPSPRTAFKLIAEHRITMASLVPPLLQAWLASPARTRFDLSSLETIQVGGAPLPATTAQRVAPELGATLQQVFGMAEGLVNYTRLNDPIDTIVHTQGRPISPDDEVLIVDEADNPVPDGTEGLLLTRGPYTIRGYFRAPRVNAESFTADGFYRTGDLVIRRPDGYLSVTGRIKDQINRAGEKIAPEEVEEALLSHPAVADALVLGLPDEYLGEKILAVVLPREDIAEADWPTASELLDHVRAAGLARFKVPDRLEVAATLPTTGVGKNNRRALRTRVLAELQEAEAGSTPSEHTAGAPAQAAKDMA